MKKVYIDQNYSEREALASYIMRLGSILEVKETDYPINSADALYEIAERSIAAAEDLQETVKNSEFKMGNKIDTIVYHLIGDMSGMELWHKLFNKMTNQAKRQLLGELLNDCLGSAGPRSVELFKKY